MFHVDVLSGYLICGAGALLGAATLSLAEATDDGTRGGLRETAWGFVILGLGVFPAGLGTVVGSRLAQFSLAIGAAAGVMVLARGLGRLQGRLLPWHLLALAIGASAVVLGATVAHDPLVFGLWFAWILAGASALMAWQTRGYLLRPRDAVERAVGLAASLVFVTSAMRLGATLVYEGPPRVDLMYVPAPWDSVLATLYGLMPLFVAALVLTLVNARLRHQLHARATTDELTGVLTRRALRELASPLFDEQRRRGAATAVLMLDLDHFKVVNDTYGHPTGDAVLRMAAALLRAHLRVDALLSRYGGEEFVAVVPVEDLPGARRVAERLRQAVERADWAREIALERGVTVSVGVALTGPDDRFDDALARADEALYRAKRDGRNQCQVGLAVA